MEVDQIQFKFPKINSDYGRVVSAKKLNQGSPRMDEEEEEGTPNGGSGSADLGRFHGWPSSRIVRVPRASAGKDRHSKVITSKGLRDRRVRLAVNTAIQFYDLQDRLGYDQPSKAVEWLLRAAAGSIAELPPMSSLFPDTPKQLLRDEKRSRSDEVVGFDSAEVEMGCGGGDDFSHHQQPPSNKSSACTSPSRETSKGSAGLSLSRSERSCRIKGKGRYAEEERESEGCHLSSSLNNSNSQTTSFTELLSGGFNSFNGSNNSFNIISSTGSNHQNPNGNESAAASRQWPSSSTSMNHFSPGLMIRPGQMQFVNSFKPLGSPLFSNVAAEDHHLHHSFSFATPDNLVPAAVNGGGSGYNLNFTMSSTNSSGGVTACFNRGTLQSNSSSSLLPLHHQVQRFLHSSSDGSPPNFLAMAPAVENHVHGFLPGLDGRLQLYSDDDAPARNSVQIKGEGKKPS